MKKLYCVLIVTMVATFLGGCMDNGSSAPPPPWLTTITPPSNGATPGDGRVKLEWVPSSGVDYWLFTATDPSLSAFNWTGLPNSHAYISAATPFYMCGLFSGTLSNGVVSPITYYFATNGRINGGPGGPSSPTISASPYNAGSVAWEDSPPASGVPATSNLNGVGYTSLTTCSNNSTSAAGSFAVVGASGAIFTSTDGKTWSAPTSPTPSDLYAVTGYATNQNNPSNPASRWVAVGAGGISVYSTDVGATWTVGNVSAAPQTLRSITHVTGTFTAVGDTGTIISTTDGITWTSHTSTSGTANNLNGVTHGNIYVAVGDNGTILTSGDGNTWTTHTTTPVTTTSNLRQVAAIGSLIVAVGDGGTVVTSKDAGATWYVQTLTNAPNLVGVAAESQLVANDIVDNWLGAVPNVQFVAIDSSGNAYTTMSSSSSAYGLTWSASAIPSGNTTSTGATGLNAIVSSGFGYVAAGNAGATAHAF